MARGPGHENPRDLRQDSRYKTKDAGLPHINQYMSSSALFTQCTTRALQAVISNIQNEFKITEIDQAVRENSHFFSIFHGTVAQVHSSEAGRIIPIASFQAARSAQ